MTIEFANVHKTLRRKNQRTPILEGASIVFPADRITGVLAPPGTGKTTIMNLATGRMRADIGRVRRSSQISFPIAGSGVFNGSLTARENLAFLCRVFGYDPIPIIRFVIDFTEIGKAIDKPFNSLNRDQRTRLLFTSCYAIPFDLYIADESLIGGRGSFRDKCVELVQDRMKTSGFLLFTSSPSLLRRYCDTFMIIDNRTISGVDTIDEAVEIIGKDRLRDGDGALDEVTDTGSNDQV